MGSLTSHRFITCARACEKGSTVYRPYPRPESLTICRCDYKDSTFSSVILRPSVLVQPGFEAAASCSADRRLSQHWVNRRGRISYFDCETGLAVIAKQSVTFFLELNYDTLTIWYQIARSVSFCVHRGNPGSVITKTMQSFDSNKSIFSEYSQPATDCRLLEEKLSIGLFSPSSISLNNNAIVRNFYPKKFHSTKLFKDLPPPNLKGICIW